MTNDNIQSLNKVILPLIRKTMPNLIAQSIVGVSPMIGPVFQNYTMKFKYDTFRINLKQGHFKVFLRLYNRRKFTTHKDILAANYHWVDLKEYSKSIPAKHWCIDNFGEYSFIFDSMYSRFYFENKEDCAMFTLTWL